MRHGEAQLRGANCGNVSAGTGADDDNIDIVST